jgi:hypothetical protein
MQARVRQKIFSLGGCSFWAAMLQVHSNELWIEHRGNCASPAEYQARLATNLPRNTWLPIVMHFVASQIGAGTLEVWFGDAVFSCSLQPFARMAIA